MARKAGDYEPVTADASECEVSPASDQLIKKQTAWHSQLRALFGLI
jgi:hypothetical protein